ncbi:pilus assembly FimT family protein [Megalodesulfovibrio paquesii]
MSERLQLARKRRLPQSGFTFIEVMTVLVLLGILARTAFMMFETDDINARAERKVLESTIRYAQVLAMADDQPWGVSINGASFELQRDCNTQADDGRLVRIPGKDSATYTIPNELKVFGSANVVFNNRGQPSDCTGTALTADVTVPVVIEDMANIVITQNTGLIQ